MADVYELHDGQQQPLAAEIFTFTIDDTVYRYTSYEENVQYYGHTYYREAIQRSGFNRRVSSRSISCTVKVPTDMPFVSILNHLTYETAALTIEKFFIEHEDAVPYKIFQGDISKINIKKGTCEILCSSFSNIFDLPIPKLFVQSYCNNSLGDEICKVDISLYENTVSIDNPTDPWGDTRYTAARVLYVDNNGTDSFGQRYEDRPDYFYNQGSCIVNGERRYISEAENREWGNGVRLRRITLHYPLSSVPNEGASVTIYPGCNKAASTCVSKYSNLENFVGFPYLPDFNPYKWGLRGKI